MPGPCVRCLRRCSLARVLVLLCALLPVHAVAAGQYLVAGSFSEVGSAEREAARIREAASVAVIVAEARSRGVVVHRLLVPLAEGERPVLEHRLIQAGVRSTWLLREWRDESAGVEAQDFSSGAPGIAVPGVARVPPVVATKDQRPAAGARVPEKPAMSHIPAFNLATLRGGSRAHPEPDARSGNLRAELAAEVRVFQDPGVFKLPQGHQSVSLQAEYYGAYNNNRDLLAFTPFLRYDRQDDDRSHVDIRDLSWIHVSKRFELRTGLRKVFWGVTETRHLVDIINQTDNLENADGEDKLGQPMVNLSWVTGRGIVDFYVLPWFRERRFAGAGGRPRLPFLVDERGATFESGAEEQHVDLALRWSHSLGDLELGLSHFEGTAREPAFDLQIVADATGRPVSAVFVPHYYQMAQSSVDAQYFLGDWAFKIETVSRAGGGWRYEAATAGFEKTFVGLFGSRWDVGVVAEYLWDERGTGGPSFAEDDIATGLRFTANNTLDSTLLIVFVADAASGETTSVLEGSTRVGANWKLVLEGSLFSGGVAPPADVAGMLVALADNKNKLGFLQDEDFLKLELVRYF